MRINTPYKAELIVGGNVTKEAGKPRCPYLIDALTSPSEHRTKQQTKDYTMKQTLSTSQAAHILLNDTNADWSWNGAYALIEWLEELEDANGESMELCPVSIRCDFSEYESATDWAKDYYSKEDFDFKKDGLDEEGTEEYFMDIELRENTCVIEFEGGVIVQAF